MTLRELAEITETEIEVSYLHDRRKFTVSLRGVAIIGNGVEQYAHGTGTSPEAAQRAYAKEIRGKRLGTTCGHKIRREFNVPKTLTF